MELRIRHCHWGGSNHCCGAGSSPDWVTPHNLGVAKKKKNTTHKQQKQNHNLPGPYVQFKVRGIAISRKACCSLNKFSGSGCWMAHNCQGSRIRWKFPASGFLEQVCLWLQSSKTDYFAVVVLILHGNSFISYMMFSIIVHLEAYTWLSTWV